MPQPTREQQLRHVEVYSHATAEILAAVAPVLATPAVSALVALVGLEVANIYLPGLITGGEATRGAIDTLKGLFK